MRKHLTEAFVAAVVLASVLLPVPAKAQSASPLSGVWILNRSLSELPREMGFDGDLFSAAGPGQGGAGARGSGRGRSGSSSPAGAAGFPRTSESYEDGRRRQQLTSEARNPPQRLTIVDTTGSVTMTNELGRSRVLHPTGVRESIDLNGVPLPVTTKREADRLSIVYSVEQDREIRYVYSRSVSPSQLAVEVQFLEHGKGDRARLVYEPGAVNESLDPPAAGNPRGSTEKQAPEAFDGRPYAELRGLMSLGILVENLSAQAGACGLNQSVIESALSKRLTDGGFAVRRNSDEDTYVYVNIITTTMPNGTCVSRYDAFLYTYATAKLSYRDQSVLVQVSLMHRGGMGSSAPSAHATEVTRGLENYVDLFITQIHDANK